jgi:hypothetical protein
MTAAVLDRPGVLFAEAADRPGGELSAGRGRLPLEELLNATLHAARTNASAECPVCHSRMTYARAGEEEFSGAECGDCGSRLT